MQLSSSLVPQEHMAQSQKQSKHQIAQIALLDSTVSEDLNNQDLAQLAPHAQHLHLHQLLVLPEITKTQSVKQHAKHAQETCYAQ